MMHSHLNYFLREINLKNHIFLNRFPNTNYKNLKIIDLGCGLGALSINLILNGAANVIGIDINKNKIDFANKNLQENYPALINKISFRNMELKNLDINHFDMIISKASLEHILDLQSLLFEMKNKLSIGGKILVGFGPLYNSPWGDHNRLKHRLPWAHVFFSEKLLIKNLNKKRKVQIKSIYDLGLNGLSLKKYKEIFNSVSGLELIDFRTNVSTKLLNKIFIVLAYIPFLKEYFTHNIYCTLKRVY